MPRYYRRRYTRVVRPKKKWASNMIDITYDSTTAGPQQAPLVLTQRAGLVQTLCVNSLQNGSPTPVILKTGNFKTQFDCNYESSTTGGEVGTVHSSVYIMYLPEGVGLTGDVTPEQVFNHYGSLKEKHPEWILSWRLIGNDWVNDINTEKVSFSSRLKRNLNSGDRIILLFLAESNLVINFIKIHSLIQFWTCAN